MPEIFLASYVQAFAGIAHTSTEVQPLRRQLRQRKPSADPHAILKRYKGNENTETHEWNN